MSSIRSAGLFGLAFSSIASTGHATVLENLIAAKALAANLFSVSYTRNQTYGSELSIGAIDKKRYTGELSYTKLVETTFWEVAQGKPTVAGKPVGIAYDAAIDTGTTLIYAPLNVTQAIYAAIPGSAFDSADSSSGTAYYTFPCSSKPDIALTFDGIARSFPINHADFNLGPVTPGSKNCVGGILGQDVHDGKGHLFGITGDEFLKSYYTFVISPLLEL